MINASLIEVSVIFILTFQQLSAGMNSLLDMLRLLMGLPMVSISSKGVAMSLSDMFQGSVRRRIVAYGSSVRNAATGSDTILSA